MRTVTYNENEWRLVPVVATHEMCSAPDSAWHPEAKVIWRQMLEAAPQPGEVVGGDKAVAWRWRSDAEVQYNKSWNLTQDAKFVALMIEAGGHVVEPLISPQPDAARDADAARYRWLRDNVQPYRNDNERPHALIKVCIGDVRGGVGWFDLITTQASVGVVTLDQAVDKAMAAGRGEVGNG